MRNIALALLLAAGTALAAPAPGFTRDAAATASSRAGFDTEKLKAITGWLQADVDKGRTPGAVVLIARDGQVVLHEAVGWADKDKKVPMQRNSIHAIASSTKLITSRIKNVALAACLTRMNSTVMPTNSRNDRP